MVSLAKEVLDYESEIIEMRRKIHQNPELSFEEKKTAKIVADRLRSLGMEVKTGLGGGTGVVGLLKGGRPGKVVALRADMDALPMEEEVEWEYKSKVKGVNHSCGHDTHVAMLLGAALLLAKHRDHLTGTVKFIFQPAEELVGPKGSGARRMWEEGVMQNPKVDCIVGIHIVGSFPSKTFALKSGSVTSHADPFWITIIGKGGHQSAPDKTIDPLFVGVQLVNALQGISSRIIDPKQPFVLSVNAFNSGTKTNIIPDEAKLQGGMRSADEVSHRVGLKYLKLLTKSICKAYGAKYTFESRHGAPAVVNNPALTEKVIKALKKVPGTRIAESETGMGSEDFSWYEKSAPGVYFMIGTKNKEKGCVFDNHNSKFKVDEDVLKYGSVGLATVALDLTESRLH